MNLQRVLGEVLTVQARDDGVLAVAYEGTVASLRTVTIGEGLELISLTQLVATELPCNAALRKAVAAQAGLMTLGTLSLVELPAKAADVVLRYNFPFAGLSEQALQTLVLMVLSAGAEVRQAVG